MSCLVILHHRMPMNRRFPETQPTRPKGGKLSFRGPDAKINNNDDDDGGLVAICLACSFDQRDDGLFPIRLGSRPMISELVQAAGTGKSSVMDG